MRVLMLDAPQAMLDERRRLGQDGRDEMWDAVCTWFRLPVARTSGSARSFVESSPACGAAGLVPHFETGLFRSDDDYRVPDQLYCRPRAPLGTGASKVPNSS